MPCLGRLPATAVSHCGTYIRQKLSSQQSHGELRKHFIHASKELHLLRSRPCRKAFAFHKLEDAHEHTIKIWKLLKHFSRISIRIFSRNEVHQDIFH